MQIAVCEKPLCQRRKGDHTNPVSRRIVLEPVLLNRPVKHGVFSLVNNKRRSHLLKKGGNRLRLLSVIVGNAHIQRLSASDYTVQCSCRFLKRRLGIGSVMVIDIHILQTHAAQALIQTCNQIFLTAPVSIRTRPHIISGFRGNHQLVPINPQTLFQNPSEIFLRRTVHRSIVICQIKMRDPMVESRMAHRLHVFKISVGTKIMP